MLEANAPMMLRGNALWYWEQMRLWHWEVFLLHEESNLLLYYDWGLTTTYNDWQSFLGNHTTKGSYYRAWSKHLVLGPLWFWRLSLDDHRSSKLNEQSKWATQRGSGGAISPLLLKGPNKKKEIYFDSTMVLGPKTRRWWIFNIPKHLKLHFWWVNLCFKQNILLLPSVH